MLVITLTLGVIKASPNQAAAKFMHKPERLLNQARKSLNINVYNKYRII